MIVRRFATLSSLMLAVTLSPCLRADETADAQKAIEAVYAKAMAGLSKGHMQSFADILAPDFTETDATGKPHKLTAEQKNLMVSSYDKLMQHVKMDVKSSRFVFRKFSLHGNKADATIEGHVKYEVPNLKTHEKKEGTSDVVTETSWIKNGNTWLL
jgi:hypothetical protein